ncbi:MAG: hypothetical protein IJA23_02810 [Clostridia bacterium]|nr:hypothetical protein [Clostridia bacterium]
MDKNVSSVNLDELKAARESLDRERGVETDPNMYNDYDPEKHKAEREQEKLARENASNYEEVDVSSSENNEESIVSSAEPTLESNNDKEINLAESDDDEIIITQSNESTETVDSFESVKEVENESAAEPEVQESVADDGEVNLNIYDTFADFEVNSGVPEEVKEEKTEEVQEETAEGPKVERVNLNPETEEDSDTIDSSSLDDFLKDLDAILSSDSTDDDEIITDVATEKFDEIKDVLTETSNETKVESTVENAEEKIEYIKPEDEEDEPSDEELLADLLNINSEENTSSAEEKVEDDEDVVDLSAEETTSSVQKDDIFAFSNYENLVDEEPTMNSVESEYNTEVLSDFSKLSTMADEMEEELNQAAQVKNATEDVQEEAKETEEVEEVEPESVYPKIEPFNFIDVISTDEFKEEDKFSYLLGKNEEGELVYGHLKDTCGTAVFTRNEDVVFSGFSSILLSLLLKNTPEEMQFVVCDAMFDSEFDVFENSSYMYFNRVAKNNREIVDTLVELSKEIEARYNNLVYAGVKTISSYNLQAEERSTEKMPYIVVFINNYAKMSQFLDSERINTCIYNILKFGRIVGVYVMLASAGEIERREINHNLPTRIAYKTEDELDSVRAIGSEGAENLTDENDFLYSTVYDEEVRHLKVANLTKKEIELVIENLEN